MNSKAPIVLALDTSDLSVAEEWVRLTSDVVSVYKLGLEFFLSFGQEGVRRIADQSDNDIFLDLKLHDIPHTVSKAARAITDLAPKYLTVHASGGAKMVAAAVESVGSTSITAVTILTSLSEMEVNAIGYRDNALNSALSLASLAVEAGATSIVCSPFEITAIRELLGEQIKIITPGVRFNDVNLLDDQVRTMNPREAVDAGADLIVIGRPITAAWRDGALAMRERAQEIASQVL